ncbi:hypothetical protein NL676_036919 [Syzygium grande]|nr:hypothetical protein NL676_036919 [Syzygium grande]
MVVPLHGLGRCSEVRILAGLLSLLGWGSSRRKPDCVPGFEECASSRDGRVSLESARLNRVVVLREGRWRDEGPHRLAVGGGFEAVLRRRLRRDGGRATVSRAQLGTASADSGLQLEARSSATPLRLAFSQRLTSENHRGSLLLLSGDLTHRRARCGDLALIRGVAGGLTATLLIPRGTCLASFSARRQALYCLDTAAVMSFSELIALMPSSLTDMTLG